MTEPKSHLRAAVSGSFHRHMEAITRVVHELATLSVRVLSPADPRIVAAQGEFLFVASDRVRSVRLVQDRHMDCIRAADFLWLVCPDGYVGVSAAMEICAATDAGVPVFAIRTPTDITLREYVSVVPTLSEAIRRAEASPRSERHRGILIDPRAAVEEAHDILERVGTALTQQYCVGDPARRVYREMEDLRAIIAGPGLMQ
jgi:hypothetical protein